MQASESPRVDLRAKAGAYVVLGLCFGGVPTIVWLVVVLLKPQLFWEGMKVFTLAAMAIGISFWWLYGVRLLLLQDKIVFRNWLRGNTEISLEDVLTVRVLRGWSEDFVFNRLEIVYRLDGHHKKLNVNIQNFSQSDVEFFVDSVERQLRRN